MKLSPDRLAAIYVQTAKEHGCLGDVCQLKDYDPDLGKVAEHFVPGAPWTFALAFLEAVDKAADKKGSWHDLFGHLGTPEEVAAEWMRMKDALEAQSQRMFPIMRGNNIPWRVIAPFDHRAQMNHSQTLERLAQRGGLDVTEALAVLRDTDYRHVPEKGAEAVLALEALVRERLAKST